MEWEFHKPLDVGPVPVCLGTVEDGDCHGIAMGLSPGIVARGQGTRSASSCHCLGVLWYLELARWHPRSIGVKCQAGETWKQVGMLIP